MNGYTFKYHIEKEKEKTYFSIDFKVPADVVKITVSYSYYRPTKGLMSDLHPTNCIDFGLEDENGNFLGWSGSSRESISVGEFSSTPGYPMQKINKGNWKILVGAYHVMNDGVDVEYKVSFETSEEKLYYGDLHVHSDASDGKLNAYELSALAKEKRLDFIALANHNNFALNFNLPLIEDFTFIPAVEWTHYKGHMNFFGVPDPFRNNFIANTKEEMNSLISYAKERGAVVSVNHPNCPICPYLWEDDDAFDMMEIWNGPMRKANTDAIAYWTKLLKKGKVIPCVGGSDFHKPGPIGDLGSPVNGVYSKSPSSDDLLDAIRNGHLFVSEDRDGPTVRIEYGSYKMGDRAVFESGRRLNVFTGNCGGCTVTAVTDYGEESVTNGYVVLKKCKFVYVIIKNKLTGRVKAVSNPIYF